MSSIPHYDDKWTRIRGVVDAILASGEHDLSRVVRLVEAQWRSLDSSPMKGVAFGTDVVLPRAALVGGRRDTLLETLRLACRPETGMVVELGSGWGHNLLNFWLWGGPKVPYYALEPAQSGRELAEELARLAPGLSLTALPFDFTQPVYDLPGEKDHLLVFTHHSIEQVTELPKTAITGLFPLAKSITAVHLEPVGWQLTDPGRQTLPGQHSLKRGYNTNLWSLLEELQDEGALTLEATVPALIGHKRKNPSTLLVWRR